MPDEGARRETRFGQGEGYSRRKQRGRHPSAETNESGSAVAPRKESVYTRPGGEGSEDGHIAFSRGESRGKCEHPDSRR